MQRRWRVPPTSSNVPSPSAVSHGCGCVTGTMTVWMGLMSLPTAVRHNLLLLFQTTPLLKKWVSFTAWTGLNWLYWCEIYIATQPDCRWFSLSASLFDWWLLSYFVSWSWLKPKQAHFITLSSIYCLLIRMSHPFNLLGCSSNDMRRGWVPL